jgi:DNA invertase Pin-like site-specific DNA recombinase
MFKLMPTITGAVAEMERELTVERIREGMAKAKRYGTRSGRPIGRPPRQLPASFKKYYPMCKGGEITAPILPRCWRSAVRGYINTSWNMRLNKKEPSGADKGFSWLQCFYAYHTN